MGLQSIAHRKNYGWIPLQIKGDSLTRRERIFSEESQKMNLDLDKNNNFSDIHGFLKYE